MRAANMRPIRRVFRAMSRVIPTTVLALAVLVPTALMAACATPSRAQEPIVLGFLGGLSGKSSDLGLAGRDGALLAVEQANSENSTDDRRIILKVADDGVNAEASAAGVRSLAEKKAIAVIGPFTSVSASKATTVADEVRIPLLSPTVSSTDFTGIDDMFLRTCSDNRSYASQLVSQCAGTDGALTACTIYDLGNRSYTESLSNHFATALRRGGGSLLATGTFTSGEGPDYSGLAKSATEVSPDMVFVIANSIDCALLSQRLRIGGFRGKILLPHWVATSNNILEVGGNAVEGALFLDNYERNSTSAESLEFVAAFRKRFGYEPSFASIHAYDAARLVILAAQVDPRREAMKRNLLGVRRFAGVQDTFDLDRYGDADRTFYLMTIQDGKFVRASSQ